MKTEQPRFDTKLPNFKFPETKTDPVEKILNMDEETFRRLFNIPKVQKVDLQGSGDEEINEVD
jgi:hypothetical protein